jgi:hypothetical protein
MNNLPSIVCIVTGKKDLISFFWSECERFTFTAIETFLN